MSKYYSRDNRPEKKPTSAGSKIRDTYKWAIDENGKKKLIHDYDEDVQAKIESYADECDIKNIVARAAFDPVFAQAIAETSGSYVDITDYPETIHDLKRRAEEAGKTIEEIKAELEKPKTEEKKEEVKNENEPE